MSRRIAVFLACLPLPLSAGQIEVAVTGLQSRAGSILCALHDGPKGFPGGAHLASAGVPADGTALCLFRDVGPGRYAVAVLHDENGNGRLDTNALGIPSEPWGVSLGARPLMRAPRFDEAAFAHDGAAQVLTVRVGR